MKRVISIDIQGLAILLAETITGLKRPEGSTGAQAFVDLSALNFDLSERYLKGAIAALKYFVDAQNQHEPDCAEMRDISRPDLIC